MTNRTAKELLDLIDQKEQEIEKATEEQNRAFEELSREHGKQFEVGGKAKLIVRRVLKGGPVRYHFRNLGKGAMKIDGVIAEGGEK